MNPIDRARESLNKAHRLRFLRWDGLFGCLVFVGIGWSCLSGVPLGCGPSPVWGEEVAGDAGGEEAYRCFERGPGRPEIQQISYFGRDPANRRLLEIYIEYLDMESDLQGGTYQFWVDGKVLSSRPFPSVRDPSAIKGNAILWLDLTGIALERGQSLQVEVEITDARGNSSNRPLVVLRALL
ncbi:hypothetical protein L6R29_02630 [Myxococcota bacterium]|nr:hypothetical protein [Myxococcota bacterium]